jgi:hypothetical protein
MPACLLSAGKPTGSEDFISPFIFTDASETLWITTRI